MLIAILAVLFAVPSLAQHQHEHQTQRRSTGNTPELTIDTIDAIMDAVKRKPEYYDSALKRFESADSTASLLDLAIVYYAYPLSQNYKGGYYHDDADKVNNLIKAGKKLDAYRTAMEARKSNPASLSLLYYAICSAPEDTDVYYDLCKKFTSLCRCILAFGDGQTCENPHKVIYVADEYMLLYHYMNAEIQGQSLMEDFCDKIEYKDKDGNEGEIYFNVKDILTRHHKDAK